MTLGGQVASYAQKAQAETLAKSLAGAEVVADQIAVIPVGVEKEAKARNYDLDQGIEKNLHAALIRNKMHDNVLAATGGRCRSINFIASTDRRLFRWILPQCSWRRQRQETQ